MKIPSDNSVSTGPLLDSLSRIDSLARGGASGGTEQVAALDASDGAALGDADPAESMLALDVWPGIPVGDRQLNSDSTTLQNAAPAGDASAFADHLADSVLAALGSH